MFEYVLLVRNQGRGQFIKVEPSKIRYLVALHHLRLSLPRGACEEEIDPFINGLPVSLSPVHRGQWDQLVGLNGHAELFMSLAYCRLSSRLISFNVAGRSSSPVSIHVPGALAQLKQYELRASKDDIAGWNYLEPINHQELPS